MQGVCGGNHKQSTRDETKTRQATKITIEKEVGCVCAVENDIKPFDPITLDNNPVDEPREWKVGRVKKYCARNVPGLLEYIENVQNDRNHG